MGRISLPLLLFALSVGVARGGTLLVLGDSLSAAYGMDVDQGWVSLLSTRLAATEAACKVINASISGETSSGGLARLPALLARHRPQVVVVELGGNDGLRGLAPQELSRNLKAIITRSRKAGAKVLLVGMRMPPNYGPAYTEAFAAVYPALARALKVRLVPFLLDGVAQDRNRMQADGMHAAPTSQSRLLANVWPQLKPLLAACR